MASCILNIGIDGGEWSASCACCFYCGMHQAGGWVGPSTTSEAMGKKNPCPCQKLKLVIQPVAKSL